MSTKSYEQVGVGLIGFGGHCEDSHAPFIGKSVLYKVLGVAEMDSKRSELARGVLSLPENAITNNYSDILENDAVQAVVITTGDDSHYTLANEALHAGKSVLVEKPAAATLEECAALSELFRYAERQGLRFWVCHPREFDESGPWRLAADLISEPKSLEERFGIRPIGALQELRYDYFYTVPSRDKKLHTSFADDKMNHNVVSALRSLPQIAGFSGAVLLENTMTEYDVRMKTIPENRDQPATVRMSGRRCAHREHHAEGIYRDWVEAIFEEGILRVEPSYGTVRLTYGKDSLRPVRFNPKQLYNRMFTGINDEFARCVLDPDRPEPLTRRARLLGTAAAILMQQANFDGMITEEALARLK